MLDLAPDGFRKALALGADAVTDGGVDALGEGARQAFLETIESLGRGLEERLHPSPEAGNSGSAGELVPVVAGDLVQAVMGSPAAQRHGELRFLRSKLILAVSDDGP